MRIKQDMESDYGRERGPGNAKHDVRGMMRMGLVHI